MKKISVILILTVIIMLGSCDKQESLKPSSSPKTAASVQTISDAEENTKLPESVSKTTKAYSISKTESLTEKDSKTTKKTTEKTTYTTVGKTTALIYEMRIKYKGIAKFKSEVSKYSSFDKLMKSVNDDKNYDSVNPFRQENLTMIFEDKKAFVPILPKEYKFKNISLCSRSFFEFIVSKNGKEESILIYTNTNFTESGKLKRSFESKQGITVYKNKSKQYCVLLDDKYLAVFSGENKEFIDELYFESIYIK